jgi:anti-anti-sigma factor
MSAIPLNLRAEIEKGIAHVAVSGELDLSNAAELEKVLLETEQVQGVERIWLDIGELEFIDSSGIAILLEAINRSSSDSNRLRLTGSPSPEVRRIIEITGIADRLPVDEQDGA